MYVNGLDVFGQSPRHNICTFIELPCYLNYLLKLHILCWINYSDSDSDSEMQSMQKAVQLTTFCVKSK